MIETCEPNCGCQCDYDVKACQEFRLADAHLRQHKQIALDAYDKAAGRYLREGEDNAD
jgi:hypothetical protein